jgi:hypothetical protein
MMKNQTPAMPATPSADADVQRRPEGRSESTRDRRNHSTWGTWVLAVAAVAVLLMGLLMLHWGRQPQSLDIDALAQAELKDAGGEPVTGALFTASILGVGDTLLEKPGGFLHNDRLPPGVIMDNMPSWECGVVMALRDAVEALRDDFTRSQTQSIEHLLVKEADLKLAMDPKRWMLPAAEDSYREAMSALRAYLAELDAGQAPFYPRADNLAEYLGLVEKRLGNFGVRLGAAAGVAVPGMSGSEAPGADIGRSSEVGGAVDSMLPADTFDPSRVDDVFFCSRGYTWALLHFMRAVQRDFSQVLADKNANEQVSRIVRDLEGAIKPMRSPMVLNGAGFGLLANHSLVAASYVARVNAAVIDLRLLLDQG